MTISESRLILEAIITSESPDGSMHVAPMGPEVDEGCASWVLKPFQSSTTFSNMRRSGRCIVHVVDDALLIAKAVLGEANQYPARKIVDRGFVLDAACHWYSLQAVEWNTDHARASVRCKVVESAIMKPFFGWNRAKHAVVEMAILASRVHLIEKPLLEIEIERYRILIEKTAGSCEREAFERLEKYMLQYERIPC